MLLDEQNTGIVLISQEPIVQDQEQQQSFKSELQCTNKTIDKILDRDLLDEQKPIDRKLFTKLSKNAVDKNLE